MKVCTKACFIGTGIASRGARARADSVDQHKAQLTELPGAVGNGTDAETLLRESCCPSSMPFVGTDFSPLLPPVLQPFPLYGWKSERGIMLFLCCPLINLPIAEARDHAYTLRLNVFAYTHIHPSLLWVFFFFCTEQSNVAANEFAALKRRLWEQAWPPGPHQQCNDPLGVLGDNQCLSLTP